MTATDSPFGYLLVHFIEDPTAMRKDLYFIAILQRFIHHIAGILQAVQ